MIIETIQLPAEVVRRSRLPQANVPYGLAATPVPAPTVESILAVFLPAPSGRVERSLTRLAREVRQEFFEAQRLSGRR